MFIVFFILQRTKIELRDVFPTFYHRKIICKWNNFAIQEVISKKVSGIYCRPISQLLNASNIKEIFFISFEVNRKMYIYINFLWEISFPFTICCWRVQSIVWISPISTDRIYSVVTYKRNIPLKLYTMVVYICFCQINIKLQA